VNNPKIFIGLIEIAGFCANLKKGFQEHGVPCTFVNLVTHPYSYGNEDVNLLVKAVRFLRGKEIEKKSSGFQRYALKASGLFFLFLTFLWALLRHNVFILVFSTTFFRYYDLPVLKFLGKRIIYVFLGSDSRPLYLDGNTIKSKTGLTAEQCVIMTAKRKRDILKIEKYADYLVESPLASHLHERHIIKFTVLGLPYDMEGVIVPSEGDGVADGMIRILHAPSDPEVKGSGEIIAMVERLQEKGYPIEFIKITGVPNSVLLQEVARCDLIIDQMYSDTPMAGLATQAAFLGKPTVVGGYGKSEMERIYQTEEIPPSFYCRPEDMEEVIESLLKNKGLCKAMGTRARDFVEKNLRPKVVAGKYLRLLSDDVPSGWLFDPRDTGYLHGWGISEGNAKRLIKEVAEKGGKEALQVSDKPGLESLLIRFSHD
jgi:hypothetical protein